jgi:hypothetical protein
VKAVVEDAGAVVGAGGVFEGATCDGADEVRVLGNGKAALQPGDPRGGVVEAGALNDVKQLAGASENERRLASLVAQISEILNRGGDLAERMLEARCLLAEGMKEVPERTTAA